jgi:hypothetical protein
VHLHLPQQRRHEEPRAQGPRQARAILRLPPLRQIVQQGRTVKLFFASFAVQQEGQLSFFLCKFYCTTGRTVKFFFASFAVQQEGQLSIFLCKFYCTTGRTVKLFFASFIVQQEGQLSVSLQVILYNRKDS